MKKKINILITIILVIFTIIISNIGQLFLSNEQFIKRNYQTNLKQ